MSISTKGLSILSMVAFNSLMGSGNKLEMLVVTLEVVNPACVHTVNEDRGAPWLDVQLHATSGSLFQRE